MSNTHSIYQEVYHIYFHEQTQTFAIHTWKTAVQVIKEKDFSALGIRVLSGQSKSYLAIFVNYFELLIKIGHYFTIEKIHLHVDQLVSQLYKNITIVK